MNSHGNHVVYYLTPPTKFRPPRPSHPNNNPRWAISFRLTPQLPPRPQRHLHRQRASLPHRIPVPLRRAPSPLGAALPLLHSSLLLAHDGRPARQRRQRCHGLLRRLLHDGAVPEPGAKRLPHHPAVLRKREHHQPHHQQNSRDPQREF